MVEDYTSPKFPEGTTFQQTATATVIAHGHGFDVTYRANSNDGSISSSVKNPDAFDKVPEGVTMKNAAGYDEVFSAEEAQRDKAYLMLRTRFRDKTFQCWLVDRVVNCDSRGQNFAALAAVSTDPQQAGEWKTVNSDAQRSGFANAFRFSLPPLAVITGTGNAPRTHYGRQVDFAPGKVIKIGDYAIDTTGSDAFVVRIGDSQITLKKNSFEAEQRQSPNGPYEPIYRSDTVNPNAYPVGKQQSQPTSKAAASKGDCSLQKLKSDTNLSGVDTVVCCDGLWANDATYASDGFHPLHWDGSKWTFPPIDGETTGVGLSRGCWNRSTIQSVGAGHCPEERRLPIAIRSLKPSETRIPRGATRNRV